MQYLIGFLIFVFFGNLIAYVLGHVLLGVVVVGFLFGVMGLIGIICNLFRKESHNEQISECQQNAKSNLCDQTGVPVSVVQQHVQKPSYYQQTTSSADTQYERYLTSHGAPLNPKKFYLYSGHPDVLRYPSLFNVWVKDEKVNFLHVDRKAGLRFSIPLRTIQSCSESSADGKTKPLVTYKDSCAVRNLVLEGGIYSMLTEQQWKYQKSNACDQTGASPAAQQHFHKPQQNSLAWLYKEQEEEENKRKTSARKHDVYDSNVAYNPMTHIKMALQERDSTLHGQESYLTITCPSCKQAYKVDRQKVKPSTKTATCKKCGHRFSVS
jgi:predicted Zn finger-like uncharacterized protein